MMNIAQLLSARIATFVMGAILICGPGLTVRLWGQAATGTVLGSLTDASHAAIPDASLEIKNVGTGVSQNVTSDAQGRFRAPELGVGEYEVRASKDGFATVLRSGIT